MIESFRSSKEYLFSELLRLYIENKSLKESFSREFNQTDTPISVSTINEGRFVEANNAFLEFFEYSRGEVIGRTSKELGIFVDFEDRQSIARLVLEKGLIRDKSVKVRSKNDNEMLCSFSGDIIHTKGESFFITICKSITTQRTAKKHSYVTLESNIYVNEELLSRDLAWNRNFVALEEQDIYKTSSYSAVPNLEEIIGLKKNNMDEKEYYSVLKGLNESNCRLNEYMRYIKNKIISI